MDRAESRRQRKKAEKAAKNAMSEQEVSPSSKQHTLTIQQAIDLGIEHQTAGRLPEAEGIYQQILQADPNQPIALHLLGLIARQVGKNKIAVDLITKALVIKPDYAEAYNNLGNALQGLGRLDEAVANYHKALAIKPDYAKANNNLGNVLKELVRMDEAFAHYQKAIDIQPDYAEAHNNLGLALQDLGRLEEAVASYQKALSVKPDYIEAYFNCGFATELQEGKEPFDPQLILDQCFAKISLDKYREATRIIHNLCLRTPYNTQQYIKAFLDRWCEAIIRILDNQQFDIAGKRMRWLYMHITDHKPFDALIQRYFDETKNEKIFATLEGREKAVHLSMQSQYFYKNGQYDEAEERAKRCVNETKALLKNEPGRDDGWLLVKKSLKNIKNSEKARDVLEQLLLSID